MKRLAWIASGAVLTSGLLASVGASAAGGPRQAAQAIFFDGFDGPSRQPRRVERHRHRPGREQRAAGVHRLDRHDRIVTGAEAEGAEGGALALRGRYRPGFTSPEGRAFDFVSGRLDTRDKVTFTYGTAAARIKLMAGDGSWPAFWALGADQLAGHGRDRHHGERRRSVVGERRRCTDPATPATRRSCSGARSRTGRTARAGTSTR